MNLSKILIATASVATVGAVGLAYAQSSPSSSASAPAQIQSQTPGQITDPMPRSTDSTNPTTGNSMSGDMNSPAQSERDSINQGAGGTGTSGSDGTPRSSGLESSDGILRAPSDRSTTDRPLMDRSTSDRDSTLMGTERSPRADRN